LEGVAVFACFVCFSSSFAGFVGIFPFAYSRFRSAFQRLIECRIQIFINAINASLATVRKIDSDQTDAVYK